MSDPFGPTDPSAHVPGSSDPTQPFGTPQPGFPPPSAPQPYGQEGYPPAPSAGMPPAGPYQQMPPPFPTAAPAPRKSRRGLWITLGVILALLVVCVGGGLFAFGQYLAPAVAAGVFCGELKAQNYPTAYNQLDKSLQGQFSQSEFVQGAQALDQIEGKVTNCTAGNSGSAYHYSLGSSTASATVTIARATAGNLTGSVHLKNENGWKIDALDTSLLGVNLGALKAAGDFCAALQSQNYTSAYALLGSQAQSAVNASEFTLGSQAHDQIDGTVSACGLAGLGQGNSDTSANLIINITRAKLGAKQGPVTLDVEGSAWKISAIDASIQGTNIQPLFVAAKLCADVISNNLTDAYQNLTSTELRASATQDAFNAFFALDPGVTITGCTPDLSTYQVTATQAQFDSKFTLQGPSGTGDVTVTSLWLLENGAWKLDGLNTKS